VLGGTQHVVKILGIGHHLHDVLGAVETARPGQGSRAVADGRGGGCFRWLGTPAPVKQGGDTGGGNQHQKVLGAGARLRRVERLDLHVDGLKY
jgi:hypothetical protein